MRLRYRIVLIICGVLLFAVLAPAAVFLARGYYIDFAHKKIIKTGTLVIKSDPKNAEVFLGEKKLKVTPSVNRFVLPGEYRLSIKMNGFRTWKKHVTIHPEVVTSVPQIGKIFLLPDSLPKDTLATSTTDFLANKDDLFFFENQELKVLGLDSKETQILATSTSFVSPKFLEEKNRQILVSDQNQDFFISSGARYPIPQTLNTPRLGLAASEIFAINQQNQLVRLTSADQKIEVVRENVASFAVGNSIYYISSSKLWQMNGNNDTDKLITHNLPAFTQSRIILTPTNQIFLLLDQSLYQVNESLKKLNDSIEYATWNENLQGLIYGNGHEIWIYPLATLKSTLVTRSLNTLGQATFNEKIGYIFVAEGREIKAIEFDPLSEPNVYTLSQTELPASKLFVTNDGSRLFYLDSQNLYSLKIR